MAFKPWQSLHVGLMLCLFYIFAGVYCPDSKAAENAIWWRSHRILLPATHQATAGSQTLQLRFQARDTTQQETYTLRYEGRLKDVDKKPGPYGHYLSFALPKTPANATDQWLKQHITQAATVSIAQSERPLPLHMAPLLDREFRPVQTQTLGVTYTESAGKKQPLLSVWAPTATAVRVVVKDAQGTPPAKATQVITQALTPKAKGIWQVRGPESWDRAYYQLEIDVYQPLTQQFQTYRTTDPYTVSLSTNSTWSQFVDLRDPDLMPPQWESAAKTYLPPEAPEDWVLYELHVRDFSQRDPEVPSAHRGKYTAFQANASGKGMRHLQQLAHSGVTHIHLLPVFDIATIPETDQQTPSTPPGALVPNSPDAQAAIGKVRLKDGFNWGYDPLHYGVPEGSYSTNPEGVTRIREFRAMVQALEKIKLGVVMDVVYNHTHAAGEDELSILDKVVPGYYYRLDTAGQVQHTSCCPDTASEHAMMEHLMIQTLVRWARDYHVRGFRFDLMGHHTRENLLHVRQALDELTVAKDGINGRSIYLYGEGWEFGSLNAVAPDLAMHQVNAAGTGIGTFNDRMRDSLRGGNFDHNTRSDQGFINGLFLNPNQSPWNTDTPKSAAGQAEQLQNYTQLIRLSMAGNLATFTLGGTKGKNLSYRGNPPAGYTQDPQENVNYVSAHDNYTLWDQIAAKAPLNTPAATRAHMQQLGMAAVILGQGVPFLHAGSEILRSKSGDGDSYDSGDWFNALDWTYNTNGWGKGLPAAWRNEKEWPFWSPLLPQAQFKPTPSEIEAHFQVVKALLQVRKASPLFRLRTAEAIQKQVRFLNAEAGKAQIPGLIAMHIQDNTAQDPKRKAVLILLNANPSPVRLRHPLLNAPWQGFTRDDGTSVFPALPPHTVPGYGVSVLEQTD